MEPVERKVDPLERVTNLVALLLEARQPLTLEQITDELSGQYRGKKESVRQAFERDKALLREVGVPITQEVLSGDQAGRTGYRIERSQYELGDLGLDEAERRALQLAVAALHLGPTWGEQAMWKLERSDDQPVGGAALAANLSSPEVSAALFTAVAERREASFHYHGRARVLRPYGLLARDGNWYVIGHDAGVDEQRTYRVDRIDPPKVTLGPGGQFERPAGFRAADAFPADPKAVAWTEDAPLAEFADVLVDSMRARGVVAELGDASVQHRHADGSVTVRVPCTNLGAFRRWLFGLLDHAVVVAPPEVRADVVAWLEEVAGR